MRTVEPELLDVMSPDDEEAMASRRDLRRINALMFHTTVLSRLLRKHVAQPPRRLVEIGCGDGHATLALARKMAPTWPGVALSLVDRQQLVAADVRMQIAKLGWTVDVVAADVFDWLRRGEQQDVALANLFLHHFEDARLEPMLHDLAKVSPTFVATEPRRSRFALLAARSLGIIGANAVTRHDAPASVRAGFSGRELTRLWPGGPERVLVEGPVGPFTHAFAAIGGQEP
ncbi:methyltransferase domain-containing protein [Roseibium salinum]|uniref:Methyltransferase domain-containing protein n=1 Tax=Roseibium salinum TaxID=1604349 RepID=A0ABT3R3F7_9HYPH|nr:methyltransferase domain-containing protein [Roseibium sp. DSM 29163]MCX2723738.1 methyltransferase domain-containing protein [Roseibium sp. DSM 29163]MDN3718413.1 methyltransferase domain-containing protein [Roseibium salinum]